MKKITISILVLVILALAAAGWYLYYQTYEITQDWAAMQVVWQERLEVAREEIEVAEEHQEVVFYSGVAAGCLAGVGNPSFCSMVVSVGKDQDWFQLNDDGWQQEKP